MKIPTYFNNLVWINEVIYIMCLAQYEKDSTNVSLGWNNL